MSDTEGVITSTEVAPKKTPKSFKDLNKPDLVAAAIAFGTEEEGTAVEIRTDLEDAGVTWDDYVKAFKLEGHENIPDPEEAAPLQVELLDDDDEGGEEIVNEVVAAPAVPHLAVAQDYLIRMTRGNPYFEFEKYKFTQDNPYAIMPAAAAQRILETEDGFRQAFPAELQEYYG